MLLYGRNAGRLAEPWFHCHVSLIILKPIVRMWIADLCLCQPPETGFSLPGSSSWQAPLKVMFVALRSHITPYQILSLLIMFPTRTHCSGFWQLPPVRALLLFLAQVSQRLPAGSEKGSAARELPCFSFLCIDSAGTCLLGAGVPDVSP